MGLVDRLQRFGLFPDNPVTNGNGAGHAAPAAAEAKELGSVSGVTMVDARNVEFFSPDSTRTIYQVFGNTGSEAERVSRDTAYAAAAYAFAAIRYRAHKIAEPPLMVVREDTEGSEDWQRNHWLAGLLEEPSPDFDMGELIARTMIYRDITGSALWLKEPAAGRPARLQVYAGNEFEVASTRDRLRGSYTLKREGGDRTVGPDRVVYFHEISPYSWHEGLSLLDVALGWLNLASSARSAVRDVLTHSLLPSVVVTADPDWNPDDDAFNEWKAALEAYALPGNRGKPLGMLGGGKAERVSLTLKDIIPGDVLNRVESVVSSVFGIPAIVLQFEVGMQNSPWSQMREARRMCYEDTIEPTWRDIEKRLTRQLLRPADNDRSLFVRFDPTNVRALQHDRLVQAQTASTMGGAASLNERRRVMGLDPLDDPKADEVPELKPTPVPIAPPSEAEEDAEEDAEDAAREEGEALKSRRQAKALEARVHNQVARSLEFDWELAVGRLLERDRGAISALAERELSGRKADGLTDAQRERFKKAVWEYLENDSQAAWEEILQPMIEALGLRSAEMMAAGLGLSLNLLRPDVLTYAEREAGWLVKEIAATTRDAIVDALTAGIEAGEGSMQIAQRITDLPAFDRDRAKLVARTETTRIMNGAPTEALIARQERTGRRYVKTWYAVLDERTRDEHAELDGEQRPIAEPFSNGRMYPDEPNCRCTTLTSAVEGL